MARRELTPAEKAARLRLLEHSDQELLGNMNYYWRKLNPKAKGKISRPSALRDFYNADEIVCVKKGITAGFRRYEVLDTPVGRMILVFAPNAVWQHGPLRWSIKTNFIWGKAGTNIPARGREGPWQPIQKRMWCTEMPSRCHVLEKFVDAFNSRVVEFPPLDIDLEGSYAPELREARLRRIVNLMIETGVPDDVVATPLDYRESTCNITQLRTSGFSDEAEAIQTAFAVSELENTVLRAEQLGWIVGARLAQDAMRYMLFSMRIKEVI